MMRLGHCGNPFEGVRGFASVTIGSENLREGYSELVRRVARLRTTMFQTGIATSAISGGWLFVTDQAIQHSPVAMAFTALGSIVVVNSLMQEFRVKRMLCLGIRCDQFGPSTVSSVNHEIHRILKGDKPNIVLKRDGIVISGPKEPSIDMIPTPRTMAEIQSMRRIKLPDIILKREVSNEVHTIFQRWVSRVAIPFNLANIRAFIAKSRDEDSEHSADDYVVMGAVISNLLDAVSNTPLKEEVGKFKERLNKANTPEELIQLLVDQKLLDGPFSFMRHWAQGVDKVSVRVDRACGLRLYRNSRYSIFGPMAATAFPKKYLLPD